jgi:hypothetical protein
MGGELVKWSKKEKNVAKPRCAITRHTSRYGRKSKSKTFSGCNKSPTRGQTRNGTHPIGVKELDLGLIAATPSIFRTKQTHVDKLDTETNTESPKKDLN